jgi:Tfp pilus assembly protein PilO
VSTSPALATRDTLHGTPLVRRVITEHRKTVTALAAALVLNIATYALVVYPLSRRVADVAGRDARAATQLRAARQEHDQAAGTLTGKDRAAIGLATFYKSVLPTNFTSARRLSFLRIFQLARESGLKIGRSSNDVVTERDSTLNRLKTEVELTGSYAAMRTFVHQLEIAPEFVVIDNVELTEDDAGGELKIKIELSTYYRTTP